MLFHEHDGATCPNCQQLLLYGVKEEAGSWKVLYCCDRCDWEERAGRISRTSVDHQDELWKRASEFGERWITDRD